MCGKSPGRKQTPNDITNQRNQHLSWRMRLMVEELVVSEKLDEEMMRVSLVYPGSQDDLLMK